LDPHPFRGGKEEKEESFLLQKILQLRCALMQQFIARAKGSDRHQLRAALIYALLRNLKAIILQSVALPFYWRLI